MWDTLSKPWQAAIEMAWEAYCIESIPIGAVVVDCNGTVLSRGHNRTLEQNAPGKQTCDSYLAHAELNALLDLNLDQESRHTAALYTTMEPCPLCMGAFYMSSIRTLHYAGRDPFAGSTNLLGKTWYLQHKPIQVFPPFDAKLEAALTALYAESEIYLRGEQTIANHFFDQWRSILPNGIDFGIELYRSGELRKRKKMNAPACEVIHWLVNQVK